VNGTRAHHLDWLSLIDADGPFLSLDVVRKVFPAGLDEVPKSTRSDARERLETLLTEPGDAARAEWIDWLLREGLEWGDRYVAPGGFVKPYDVPEYRTTVVASGALLDPSDHRVRLVVLHVPYRAAFDARLRDEIWNASPLERATLLARANGAEIALIEDGERIAIVNVPEEGTIGHAIWPSDLFGEGAERALFASFVGLLHARRFFNVVRGDEPAAMFERSATQGAELTKTLGFQVRRAVELFVAALSSVDRDDCRRQGRGLLDGVPPHEVYVAAATVMMRAIFLLYAEERGLLPLDDPLYAESYALSTLREQIEAERQESGDEPLERRTAAWRRMLATFSAIYGGVKHDRLRTIAYGGRLFDPERFPFLLEARIDDLTIATILRALQVLETDRGSVARRLSFRELDVEQIGHVYESLLDHDARRATGVVLGFTGKSGDEPEIDLAAIEAAAAYGRDALITLLVETTGRNAKAIGKDLDRSATFARERDVDATRRVRRACENDVGIAERVLPYVAFLRDDLHGVPTVFLPGSMLVRKTRARRDSGTEYTPRVLAEEIVRYTLEPLCYSPGPVDGVEREAWVVKPSEELLALKICDPACGSGAFLVAACRYLADRITEAWSREAQTLEDDPTREARRRVAQRCVYGVDRDGMAVEMAKLSLWLLTFARERPFGFLDHAIREGDSLLGISSIDQLINMNHDFDHGRVLHGGTLFDVTPQIRTLVAAASSLRKEIEGQQPLDVRDVEFQLETERRASQALAVARAVADGLVGIELAFYDRPERERDAAHLALADAARSALTSGAADIDDAVKSGIVARLNQGRPEKAPRRKPFHWPLEFPEVFEARLGKFDALVGNPPFLGGKFVTGRFGTDYRSVLLRTLADGRRGHADLVAYFVLRAAQITRRFGFVTTNSIAQGDTREVALDSLTSGNWEIVRAAASRAWPGDAAIQIAELWCAEKPIRERVVLDARVVSGISPLLVPVSRVSGSPRRLGKNLGVCFIGSFVLGMGFTMLPAEADRLIRIDQRNSEVLFPYLNGENACDDPQQRAPRWIVNFFDWSEERSRTYQMFDQVEQLVRPERQRKKADGAYVLRSPLPKRWWQYADKRPALKRRIEDLNAVIIIPLVSKYSIPVMVEARQVFSHALAVFASNDFGLYGMLTSELHRAWARSRGSTLETRSRYTPTDCFETFPLPDEMLPVAEPMRRLHEHRAETMIATNRGITKTYNRYHDSACMDADIRTLRNLHEEVDAAALAAYGWRDLDLTRSFRETDQGVRFTIAEDVRVAILDFLLETNLSQTAAEAAKGGVTRRRRKPAMAGSGVPNDRESLSEFLSR